MGDSLSLLSVIFNRYKNERGAPERARLEKEFAEVLRAAKSERDSLLDKLTGAMNTPDTVEETFVNEIAGELVAEKSAKKYKKDK